MGVSNNSKLSSTILFGFVRARACVSEREKGSEEVCLIKCSPTAHCSSSISLEESLLTKISGSINSEEASDVLQSHK